MKTAWKIILLISCIMMGLAIVCVIGSVFTGGSLQSIYENEFAVTAIDNFTVQHVMELIGSFFGS